VQTEHRCRCWQRDRAPRSRQCSQRAAQRSCCDARPARPERTKSCRPACRHRRRDRSLSRASECRVAVRCSRHSPPTSSPSEPKLPARTKGVFGSSIFMRAAVFSRSISCNVRFVSSHASLVRGQRLQAASMDSEVLRNKPTLEACSRKAARAGVPESCRARTAGLCAGTGRALQCLAISSAAARMSRARTCCTQRAHHDGHSPVAMLIDALRLRGQTLAWRCVLQDAARTGCGRRGRRRVSW
jgi:hypothetical protein